MPAGVRNDEDSEVLTRAKKPKLYKVILLNDNYTTMEFVVYILQKYFQKNEHEAKRIMLDVHNNGSGVAGIYPREVAETKVKQVMAHAEQEGFPLACKAEPE
ncbi:MAG TPA: ATP-dependent Clp protease adapter ClpS [Turneriella sp.]|nr:ATP-dependent Clp protease adapter ClpS [Turneriella sp.]HNE18548.1 ATP-dependent Clp protease adapter ClpS [Turneriella sp.]HNL11675.1 ATP-dependent Clp protease adapter ClpS [Turneriella sp.]HNL52919.1 ATP-dependent Clp protease adapter ClpS [Turneriella sp.]HNM99901.1 ATP-dependent Clp protease adapter ClpS [Turneriella sp.]